MSASAVLALAVDSGLVNAGEALCGDVTVGRVGASNQVLRLDRRGATVAFVKSAGEAARMDGTDAVGNERAVLTRLFPAASVLAQTTASELWLAPVPGVPLTECVDRPDVLSEAFAALGTTLAGLHRRPLPADTPRAPLPWPLLDRLPPHMRGARDHAVSAMVVDTAAQLAAATAAARASWDAVHWIHGDVSAMNVLVEGEARLVDWEHAGAGAPSWDLVGAQQLIDYLAPGWADLGRRRFSSAYRAAGGTADEPGPALRCVRLLVSAYQLAAGVLVDGGTPDTDGSISALLDRARDEASRVQR